MKIGDKIKDNDPRMGNRVLKIIGIYQWGVCAVDSMGRERDYGMHRIFTDGKPRRSGLSLVTPGDYLPHEEGTT